MLEVEFLGKSKLNDVAVRVGSLNLISRTREEEFSMGADSSTQPSEVGGSRYAGKTTPLWPPFVEESKDLSSVENQILKVLHLFDIDRCRIAQFHTGIWWEED